MLPKIIVAGTYERESLLSDMGLSASSVMSYEGAEGKIDDLRHFINFGINVSAGTKNLNLLIWDADRLSPECQAVLLKPLEDSSEGTSLLLVTANENSLLPTVLSRCVITTIVNSGDKIAGFWKKILECFAKGPSLCLAFADELEKKEMESALEETINKLKSGLDTEVNKNRLKILKLSVDCLAKIRFTNVNAKLTFGNYLINSWRLIKG
jgi:Flp pilus assembly pilin Flp